MLGPYGRLSLNFGLPSSTVQQVNARARASPCWSSVLCRPTRGHFAFARLAHNWRPALICFAVRQRVLLDTYHRALCGGSSSERMLCAAVFSVAERCQILEGEARVPEERAHSFKMVSSRVPRSRLNWSPCGSWILEATCIMHFVGVAVGPAIQSDGACHHYGSRQRDTKHGQRADNRGKPKNLAEFPPPSDFHDASPYAQLTRADGHAAPGSHRRYGVTARMREQGLTDV